MAFSARTWDESLGMEIVAMIMELWEAHTYLKGETHIDKARRYLRMLRHGRWIRASEASRAEIEGGEDGEARLAARCELRGGP